MSVCVLQLPREKDYRVVRDGETLCLCASPSAATEIAEALDKVQYRPRLVPWGNIRWPAADLMVGDFTVATIYDNGNWVYVVWYRNTQRRRKTAPVTALRRKEAREFLMALGISPTWIENPRAFYEDAEPTPDWTWEIELEAEVSLP